MKPLSICRYDRTTDAPRFTANVHASRPRSGVWVSNPPATPPRTDVVRAGLIVAEGTPEEAAANKRSFTGEYLRSMLARAREAAE